jgi:hypothetical protein
MEGATWVLYISFMLGQSQAKQVVSQCSKPGKTSYNPDTLRFSGIVIGPTRAC